MASTAGSGYEITIGGQSINIVSKPGTGADTGKLRLWLNGEKNLHENQDCVKVLAAYSGAAAQIYFETSSHLVNNEPEVHDLYGEVEVEKNGTVVVTNRAWTTAHKTTPMVVGDFSLAWFGGGASTGFDLNLNNVKVGDIIKFKFAKLYWLTPNGRSHEFDHGDPNVVIKVVSNLPTTESYPDC